MTQRPLILVYVQQTLTASVRSGVQQVVISLCKTLPTVAEVAFVKWDKRDGQLRYLDARDFRNLFLGGDLPPNVRVSPHAHRVNYRFSDTLPGGDSTWLLFPEIAYHGDDGTEIMTRICAMCREYRVKTAAIFYDAIPITNISYRVLRAPHARYAVQLARCDRIYAISRHSKGELEKLYARYLCPADPDLADLCSRIVAVPLGEAERAAVWPSPGPHHPPRTKILLLGTVEPRKRQLQVLKAFKRMAAADQAGLDLHVVGSLHPDVATEFNALIASSAKLHYHGYASAGEVEALFASARFSIFASDDEGFGLPITESLARGVPCLTANFGAMAETARGGGCLTVDVTDTAQLTRAMTRLASDDALLRLLRHEIATRKLRTWHDYAQELARDMQAASAAEADDVARLHRTVADALTSCLAGETPGNGAFSVSAGRHGPAVKLVIDAADRAAPISPSRSATGDLHEFRIVTGELTSGRKRGSQLSSAAGADLWAFRGADTLDALIAEAKGQDCSPMIPSTCIVEQDQAELISRAAGEATRLLRDFYFRRRVADRERLVCNLTERWRDSRAAGAPLLTIVISTFNRARFVQENVRWLLGLLPRFGDDIRLVVVDNASTDDTLDRLAEFAASPRLTIISNPVNVGMLGNLRVCSVLAGSRHVWITGDDDFIVPAGLAEVIDALREHPETPFVVVNFGVYHRTRLGANDTAQSLIAERVPLAPAPSPSGLYTVARIAEQHDNLFTAFYPIVFRSDVLAACFNYPFDGKPFCNLVECVPTTKMLLETYGSTQAYWCATLGTVGNANNSWSHHRPRWHAVLMPRMFRLAREAGVDATRLQQWSALHFELFHEAKHLAIAKGVDLDIRADELEDGYCVFRRSVSLA